MANSGFSFERSFCKQLTLWWTGDASADVIFWRTAGSGARATSRRKSGKKSATAHCGDLAAIDPVGAPLTKLITFELKSGYKADTLHDLLDRPDSAAVQEYEEWVFKARTAAANAGTPYWAIVHWRKRREITMTIPGKLHDVFCMYQIKLGNPIFESAVKIREGSNESFRRLVSFRLSAFLDGVTPTQIRKIERDYRS